MPVQKGLAQMLVYMPIIHFFRLNARILIRAPELMFPERISAMEVKEFYIHNQTVAFNCINECPDSPNKMQKIC